MKTQSIFLASTLVIGVTTTSFGGVVTSIADSGPGSLRNAIAMADPDSPDRISFDPSLDGATITLAGTPLVIGTTLDIRDALPNGITIDAAGASRVFEIESSADVRLNGLTITGGQSPPRSPHGGGIRNEGFLQLTNCSVIGNATSQDIFLGHFPTSGGHGGGIYNLGGLHMSYVRLSGNRCAGAGSGPNGNIGSSGSGGGLFNLGAAMLDLCTVSDNGAGEGAGPRGGSGGGIHNQGSLTISRTVLAGNTSGQAGPGAGLYNSGTATVEGSTLTENVTGDATMGVVGHWGYSGMPGGDGGGIFNSGTLLLRTSTISGNRTGDDQQSRSRGRGAGIANFGTLQIIESTVAGNITGSGDGSTGSGGGIFNMPRNVDGVEFHGIVGLENSIVAANQGEAVDDANILNAGGTLTFTGNNLTSGDPMLAPLGDYGGGTQTMPPKPGSPAIDAGVVTEHTSISDQRGFSPRIVGAGLDLGSHETGNPAGFAAWTAEMIPMGTDMSFSGDANGDGISNGLAYGGVTTPLILTRSPEGQSEIVFGYRGAAELDLSWRITRSTDLATFTEILRIEGGETIASSGVSLIEGSSNARVIDTGAAFAEAFYRVEVELSNPNEG